MSSSGLNLEELFPLEERKIIWKKSNIMFKTDMDTVLKFWRRFADPLRGTLLKAYNKYILISHVEPYIIHVSDIVRYLIYGEVAEAVVTDEKKIRILARGILYHYLFMRRFGGRVKAVYEFPITWCIDPFTIVGNVDILIPSDSGVYLIELKSSSTENTVNFGVLQTKIYWCILEKLMGISVIRGYVLTPKLTVEVDKPITKRELKKLIKIYAKAIGKLEELTTNEQ